jgi:hypothetical protein
MATTDAIPLNVIFLLNPGDPSLTLRMTGLLGVKVGERSGDSLKKYRKRTK